MIRLVFSAALNVAFLAASAQAFSGPCKEVDNVFCTKEDVVRDQRDAKAKAKAELANKKIITDPKKIKDVKLALYNLNMLRPDPVRAPGVGSAFDVERALTLFQLRHNVWFAAPGEPGAITQQIYDHLRPHIKPKKTWRWVAVSAVKGSDAVYYSHSGKTRESAIRSLLEFCSKKEGDIGNYDCGSVFTEYSTPQKQGWVAVMKCSGKRVVRVTNSGITPEEAIRAATPETKNGTLTCAPLLVVNSLGKRHSTR